MSDARTNLTLVAGYNGSDGSRRVLARGRPLAIAEGGAIGSVALRVVQHAPCDVLVVA